jgi:hypothetical protein
MSTEAFPGWTDGSFPHVITRHSINLIPELSPPLQNAAVQSYATALRVVFISQIATSVLALVACAFIEERPLLCVSILNCNTSAYSDTASQMSDDR